ncbi:MAG: LLM class flavin-dependent oxidoreductase [Alphaproteobacteria bacterium]|nr:LLM class flavin-dependent oxidoreductase [Alphaproteobacteria bacterium]
MRLSFFTVQDHYPGRPRGVPDLYRSVLALADEAEALGYDTFFSAEHHFHEYGAVPNPAVLLSAIAQRTRRLRLGTAIATLPFHNPVNLAETYAMVDVLSGGRLVLGVGSGYLKHEFAGYGIDPAEKRERFDEALTLLRRLLAGERVTMDGRFTRLTDVQLNVLPLQAPVPIYVAVLARDALIHVGRAGHDVMCVPYASVDRIEDVAAMVETYRTGRREAELDPAETGLWTFHTHVAESDAGCRREAEEAFNLYVATRLYAKRQTYDDILESGLGLFGSVERVADRLVELHGMGIRHVVALQNFGLMAEDRVVSAMRLLTQEVMPRVRARLAHEIGAH